MDFGIDGDDDEDAFGEVDEDGLDEEIDFEEVEALDEAKTDFDAVENLHESQMGAVMPLKVPLQERQQRERIDSMRHSECPW